MFPSPPFIRHNQYTPYLLHFTGHSNVNSTVNFGVICTYSSAVHCSLYCIPHSSKYDFRVKFKCNFFMKKTKYTKLFQSIYKKIQFISGNLCQASVLNVVSFKQIKTYGCNVCIACWWSLFFGDLQSFWTVCESLKLTGLEGQSGLYEIYSKISSVFLHWLILVWRGNILI